MNRRHFTLALLAATAPLAITRTAVAQTAPGMMPAGAYLAMASKGSMLLEETSRDAFEKTGNPRVKAFARAEVVEQVGLSGKLERASGGMPGMAMAPGAPGMVGGVVGGVVGAPLAVAGGVVAGTAGAAGAVLGVPMTSDAQKADMIASMKAMPGGPAYDAAYVNAQIQAHQEAYALHDGYARGGDNPELRRVARGALPLIRVHLATLNRLQSRMGGAALQG